MRTLHRRGVKGYVTFNTLVFDHELAEAARALAAIAEAGADAIIVQDLGVAAARPPDRARAGAARQHADERHQRRWRRLWRRICGATRVTLARELSLAEMRAIRAQTDCELEIFVHGALCVAYSGQCFSSEAWGGRSANRGQCAQACRLPYELMVDGASDAARRRALPALARRSLRAAPDSRDRRDRHLRAEDRRPLQGRRLRRAHHARVPQGGGRGVGRPAAGASRPKRARNSSRSIRAGSGRSSSPAPIIRRWCTGRAPRHRGVLMGRVAQVDCEGVLIEPSEAHRVAPLKPGDGRGVRRRRLAQPRGARGRRPRFSTRARAAASWNCGSATAPSTLARIRPGDLRLAHARPRPG